MITIGIVYYLYLGFNGVLNIGQMNEDNYVVSIQTFNLHYPAFHFEARERLLLICISLFLLFLH